MTARVIVTDPVEPNIVIASEELPATPDGLVKSPERLFEIEPPDIDRLRKMFNEARDLTQQARILQKKDRDYYDGPKQLQSDVRSTLKMRGQPAIYTNRVRPAIDGILGVLEGSKVDPRAYPRNPDDEDSASVATKTLRYIADKARYQQTKLDAAEDFFIEGIAAVIIEGEPDEVPVSQIRHEEFFYDPRSRRSDFKDARYLGFAKWLYADVMKELYPDAYAAMGDPIQGGIGVEATWGDRPEAAPSWVDAKMRRMLVVTLYYEQGGEWYRCVYCAAGAFDHGKSGYTDEKGFNICPIEAQSCYVDGENNRYGRVRDMIPIQDEVNARRSRLLHLANSRQIQQVDPSAQPVNSAEARREAAKADGIIPAGWQIVQTQDIASGQAALLAESKSEIERMGPTPAVLGRQGEASQSGRARLVLQQAGLTELARPMGRFDDFDNRCYRAMWRRAQQFWTEPMWIRVTDDLKAPEFIKVNEPVMGMVMQPQPVIDPETGQPAVDADGQPLAQLVPAVGVVGYKNRLAELDMDIIVDSVPDQANLEAETFAEFGDLVRGGLDPFSPQFEVLLEMSPIADKAKVLERLRAKRDEIQQAQAKAQAEAAAAAQRAQQIAEAGAIADIGKTEAETNKIKAETEETHTDALATALGHLSAITQPKEAVAES